MSTAYDLAPKLPGIEELRDRARALAVLSAIFLPDLTVEAVQAMFELRPFTQELVSAVNPSVELSSLTEDIRIIGYPV